MVTPVPISLPLVIQSIVNGLSIGTVLAVVALGLTLVFSILKVPNFAHGTIYTWGAFAAWILVTAVRLDFFLAMLVAAALIALLGIGVEKLAFRPLTGRGDEPMFISSMGVLIIMENVALMVFGREDRSIPTSFSGVTLVVPDLLFLPSLRLMIIIVSVAALLSILVLVRKTKVGKAMRAVGEDRSVARFVGINDGMIASLTFAVSGALAAVAGALIGATFLMAFDMGTLAVTRAFVVVILGGLGSIIGAIVGGLTIGMIESLVITFVSSEFQATIGFTILILILIFRPRGFFGERER